MGPFVFLDIETTGFDPDRDHIIEIACVKWQDGKILDRFESLVNPRVLVPREIVMLTGISDASLLGAPVFSHIKERIVEFVGNLPIVGHNIAFDTGFLKSHHFDLTNSEIDTVSLARILLAKEPSYALEVLMKKYKLPARNSHRAMADVETTVHFFEFLLGKIVEIPGDVLAILKPVLEKSEWAGKGVFNVIARSERSERRSNPVVFPTDYQIASPPLAGLAMTPNWSDHALKTFLNGQKILLESSSAIPFDSFKNTPLVIAYSSLRKRNELLAAAAGAGVSVAQLKEPSFYLSPKKLAVLAGQARIPSEITPFLLKILLWNVRTQTGDREEITLEREEYGLFELVADSEGDDAFWKKAREQANECTIVLVHQYGLARGLCDRIGKKRALVITEAGSLEDSFTNAMKKRYTEANLRPFFGEKATVIFGLLGIFYEHFVETEYGGYRGNVILDETLRNSLHWKRVLDAAANLPEHEKKDEFVTALMENQNTVHWVSFFANEVFFTSAPIVIAEAFRKSLSPFPQVLLQSENLSIDGTFRFIKSIFGLGQDWKEVKEESAGYANLDIKMPEDFPEPNSDGYFKKCLSLFSQIIEKKKGKSLLLLSSKKAVEAFYSALLEKANECGIKLLGVGASGGTGKSLALFLENPGGCVLLSTSQIIPYLDEIEDDIDEIVFQKIPFDAPGDPLCKACSSQFENGFNEYTLPRAIMKFRELLTNFSRGKPKTCHILDSRIHNREYGRLFI